MSLIIKITQNGLSKEYLFNKLGPIIIGSDERSDLWLNDSHIEAKLLEVKISGGNIFIKELGARSHIYLDSVIIPFREEVRYHDGNCISLKDTNYQIHIYKPQSEVIEPPPFFEGEFKERLNQMNLRIREKEIELQGLEESQDKKTHQLIDIENSYHKHASEKGKLEVEVNSLRAQKDVLNQELKRSTTKNQDEEQKVSDLRDFVKRLENEESSLKENIATQGLVLANLKDTRDKRSQEVDEQRMHLVNLHIDTSHMESQLQKLNLEFQSQEVELELENSKIEKTLSNSQAASRESIRIQAHIAQLSKEQSMLDHDVKRLQYEIGELENTRKLTFNNLQEINKQIDISESSSLNIQEQILRHHENENNLKELNNELHCELLKAEEKLGTKKNLLSQLEFQSQDATRKLTTVSFELERASLRLKELSSEEMAQELKMQAIRDELQVVIKRSGEEKQLIHKSFNESKNKLEYDLLIIKDEIEDAKKILSQVHSEEDVLRASIEENMAHRRELSQQNQAIENQVSELRAQKTLTETQIQNLKNETLKFEHDKGRIQRELSQLQMKLLECEKQMKEMQEQGRLDLENYKREERAKMSVEKSVFLSEIQAFKQKSLIEVENEYRKKQDDIHQQKSASQEQANIILKEARIAELHITNEANDRLKQATIEASERELTSHARVKEAQEYFKQKELEADQIIQRSKLEARDLIKKTELELTDDFSARKLKVKKFLTMKQEVGLAHIKLLGDQHVIRMRRNEEKGLQRIEDLKRKELKKIVRLRDEELSKQNEMKDVVMNELKASKLKVLKEIGDLKRQQEAELAEKRKSVLENIHSTKFHHQKSWEEEVSRERELFNRSKKERISNATQAVLNVFVSEAGGLGEREQILKDKIQNTLSMAIDGQNAKGLNEVDHILDFNPLKRKKIIPVLKKFSTRVGIPAAVLIILLADVGSFRTMIVDATKELIKQRNSASEIYVTQKKNDWKEKNTFSPETTLGYKSTYADNILYTTDFEEVVDSEEFQNDWILKVHDFIVRELELSEDLAINYISAEGTLLKELALVKKDIHPQFLENGIKKLTDLEQTHLGWMSEKITDPLKMEKFVNFRREYYDRFYQEKFKVSRDVASEAKITTGPLD